MSLPSFNWTWGSKNVELFPFLFPVKVIAVFYDALCFLIWNYSSKHSNSSMEIKMMNWIHMDYPSRNSKVVTVGRSLLNFSKLMNGTISNSLISSYLDRQIY
jgi:hypothetical protein